MSRNATLVHLHQLSRYKHVTLPRRKCAASITSNQQVRNASQSLLALQQHPVLVLYTLDRSHLHPSRAATEP